ncbi:fused MFS/spermidine synthase [Legionella bozemanae]|uniref:Spermidine synthase n=1 Tax=Legionella bozemanae TaxID=447 RepID=A0A0W0RJ72_LEGBO|nr:fused MFS/spermidine synthase [Legionella bozemanae]KTC71107.1 spermidine synthase [Legionella bozemanae]STO33241.1 spermidine synthase [Legionella bozemanae]
MRFLFPISLFLSAILLFSIQPMVAKSLLPVYGGTPAVWTVCMLFFQVVLLFAYGYAAVLGFFNKPNIWRATHTVLVFLSFIALPLVFQSLILHESPEWSILSNLFIQLGLPLLVIGASAPLLQFAYSQTKEKGAADPYFLYAASNLGSLLSLLLYPWVIERFIGLKNQFYLWNIGYVIYVALLFFILLTNRYQPLEKQNETAVVWSWQKILYWIFLSFVPCSLMLGVTLYITTDIAATPLFWVLPLALYLLTFVLVFTNKPLISFPWIARNSVFFLIFPIIGFILNAGQIKAWQGILFHLLSFFILALLCHSQLFLSRPKPQSLTLFYFCLALGGVLAGVFNGILAPHWFNQIYEYPLAILLSLFALPQLPRKGGWWVPVVVLVLMLLHYTLRGIHWPGGFSSFQVCAILALIIIVIWQESKTSLIVSLLILFGFIFSPLLQNDSILVQVRDFYGVKKVIDKQGIHVLINQSTVHGLQAAGENKPTGLTSYYGAVKPLVDVMQQKWNSLSVTIIGLGIGTMICQFRKEDQIKVIEIDNQVIALAKNSQLFTYLRDCPAQVTIIKNDGRLAVEQLPDHSQNLLVIDAFSSDAIPVHLLTLEAFILYQQKITEDGGILIHLSNRHMKLLPVINAAGRSLELMVLYLNNKGMLALGQFDSQWAFLTSNENLALQIMKGTHWQFNTSGEQFLWTDNYSNLIPLLKW